MIALFLIVTMSAAAGWLYHRPRVIIVHKPVLGMRDWETLTRLWLQDRIRIAVKHHKPVTPLREALESLTNDQPRGG